MTPRALLVGISASLFLVTAVAAQQAAPPRAYSAAQLGTAQIGGVVTTADGSDQPIRRAIVRIMAPELRGSREIATDDRGRFLFPDLPAGRYQLSANKLGYVSMGYGQKRPRGTGTTISLADGQKETALRMSLPKGAVVTGRVLDPSGQPIARARLQISERATVNGQLTLSPAPSNNVATNGRGEYRLYGLAAGTYVVSVSVAGIASDAVLPTTDADVQWAMRQATASTGTGYSMPPPTGQTVVASTTYYPSAIEAADATAIDLEPGAERVGVDITVRLVPVASVSGTVTSGSGPVPGATVILVAESIASSGSRSMQNSRTTDRGEFTFSSVKTGQYKVMVQASSRPGAGGRGGGPLDLWGMAVVDAGGRNITGVTVTLQPGMTFSGRIAIDSAATTVAPDLTATHVQLTAAQSSGASFGVGAAAVTADGTFVMTGAAPGPYRMQVSPPLSPNIMGAVPIWVTKSVMVDGHDVMERPFEIQPGQNIDGAVITLTDRVTLLSGKLLDAQGKAALDYSVVVMSVDKVYWIQGLYRGPRSTRPASDGTFRFSALPPGEYYVAAATDFNTRDLSTESFLEELIPSAIKITIADGEKKVQDLKIR